MVWKETTKPIFTEEAPEELEREKQFESGADQFTYIEKTKGRDGEIKEKVKVSIEKVTDYLLSRYYFKTIFGSKGDTIYLYENGIYNLRARELIKTQVESLLRSKCSNHIVAEVFEKIKRKTAIDKEEFDKIPEELICLNNGIFNIKTKELISHNPEYYFKTKLDIDYDSENKNEKIVNFIEEVCYPENVPVIQEWLGFCLYRKYFIKKAMILFGEKNTGKTVFLNILTKFIGGQKNFSGISLQRIASKDKFSISFLKDKLINVYDDLSSDDLKDAGGFKIAVGGGYATGEHKFGDSFQFLNYAKNIFATNTIPSVNDIDDDAYYERWMPIPFDNQVEGEKQDNFLFDKITTPEELSGLLNWALQGLSRLLENGKFSYNKDSDEIKKIMQRQSNPLVAFAQDVLIRDDGNKISKENMFRIYSKWCQDKEVPRMSKEQIGRNLAKHTNYMISKGGKERIWENVNVRNNHDTFDTFLKT